MTGIGNNIICIICFLWGVTFSYLSNASLQREFTPKLKLWYGWVTTSRRYYMDVITYPFPDVNYSSANLCMFHDDVMKWKHFPRNWPFVRGIHRSPVNSPHKGQWHGALMFSVICVWINGWVNNREAGDLRRHRAHYHVSVMWKHKACTSVTPFTNID